MNDTTPSRHDRALPTFRALVALLIALHGWHRLLWAGSPLFGDWLLEQGIPLGHAIAWGVTIAEIVGSPCLALGWRVRPWAALYIAIYTTGLVLVHLPEGWFVVGPGRNGMEFSVLLIGSLALLAAKARHPPGHDRGPTNPAG